MNLLLGVWIYSSLIYQGHPIPRPDPNLQMYITFSSETNNQLFYYWNGQPGSCKRTANYSVQGNKLFQKINEVDSDNSSFCSSDSDMQLNAESETVFSVTENCLLLDLPLGEETITYVWKRSDHPDAVCDMNK